MKIKLETILSEDVIEHLRTIAKKHYLSLDAVLTESQHEPVVRARDEMAYVLKDDYGMSYPFIGKVLLRDHSSVMDAVRRFAMECGDLKYAPPKSLARAPYRSSRRLVAVGE